MATGTSGGADCRLEELVSQESLEEVALRCWVVLLGWGAVLLGQDQVVPGLGFGAGGCAVASRGHLEREGPTLCCHIGRQSRDLERSRRE